MYALTQGLRSASNIISKKSIVLGSTKYIRNTIASNASHIGIKLSPATQGKDLGVSTSADMRRTIDTFAKRIIAVRGRVKRIKTLGKVTKKASRLFNTGALPQATYGKEAAGASPTAIDKLRALAANAASSQCGGQCATTIIHLVLGEHNDPGIKCITDQISMWFNLLENQDMIKVTKAWWKMKERINHIANPWKAIAGPLGATIGTLYHIGWDPISPMKWRDTEGTTWIWEPGQSAAEVIQAVRARAKALIWQKAPKFTNGTGLDEGFDQTVVKTITTS